MGEPKTCTGSVKMGYGYTKRCTTKIGTKYAKQCVKRGTEGTNTGIRGAKTYRGAKIGRGGAKTGIRALKTDI